MSVTEPFTFDDLRAAFRITKDTPVIRSAFDHARRHSPPYLFNHVVRSWLFAVFIGAKDGSVFDEEVVAVSALFHDMGLTAWASGPYRFEVNGANAAREFARQQGFDERRAQLVWDGIALHTTPTIGVHKEIEVALAVRGVGTDFGRRDYASFTSAEIDAILRRVPRLNLKREFKECVCAIAREQPESTYNNFIREFGERFVEGYAAPSVVDLLMGGPFSE